MGRDWARPADLDPIRSGGDGRRNCSPHRGGATAARPSAAAGRPPGRAAIRSGWREGRWPDGRRTAGRPVPGRRRRARRLDRRGPARPARCARADRPDRVLPRCPRRIRGSRRGTDDSGRSYPLRRGAASSPRRPARQTAQVGSQGRHSRKQCEDGSHDGQAVAELAQRDLPWRSRRTPTGSRRQRRKVNNLVDGMPGIRARVCGKRVRRFFAGRAAFGSPFWSLTQLKRVERIPGRRPFREPVPGGPCQIFVLLPAGARCSAPGSSSTIVPRPSTAPCGISPARARALHLAGRSDVPDEFDLWIEDRNQRYRAQVRWRRLTLVGVEFVAPWPRIPGRRPPGPAHDGRPATRAAPSVPAPAGSGSARCGGPSATSGLIRGRAGACGWDSRKRAGRRLR